MMSSHGGARKGAGRKAMPPEERSIPRSITLTPTEWQMLEQIAPDGSATKEAARRVRKTLQEDKAG